MVKIPRLTEPVQQELKQRLRQVTIDIEDMLKQIDNRDCSILNEFEQIHDIFKELQKTAGSHYLNAYLSPFTGAYQSLTKAIQHFSEQKHGALIAVERENQLDAFTECRNCDRCVRLYSIIRVHFLSRQPTA